MSNKPNSQNSLHVNDDNIYSIITNEHTIQIFFINEISNTLGHYPIIYFSYFVRNIDILNGLINLGADLLVTEGRANTNVLHFAAISGDAEIVTILLAANPNLVNIEDREETTPLMYAAMGGNPEVIQILINAGANPHDIDSENHNALNYAIEAADEAITNLLEPYELLFPHMDFLGS